MMRAKLPELVSPVSMAATVQGSDCQPWDVIVPDLYCPFPTAINPCADVVNQATRQWARSFLLIPTDVSARHLDAAGLGWLAARTHPHATLEDVQLIADWCSWLFIRDDYSDETGLGCQPAVMHALHIRLLAILRGACATSEDNPLVHSFADLCARTLPRATTAWRARFFCNLEQFFAGGVWEATNRAQDLTPDLVTYVHMRPFTSGMYPYIDLIEIAGTAFLPDAVLADPTVRQLMADATSAACWVNDILSFPKELKRGDVHNLVLIMQAMQHISLQEAVNRATALHDAHVRGFIKGEHDLPSFGADVDQVLACWIDNLHAYMRGNLDWSSITCRYVTHASDAVVPRGPGEGSLVRG